MRLAVVLGVAGGLIIGAAGGFYFGFYHSGRPSVATVWAANGASERAYLAYRTGTLDSAESEILGTIKILEALDQDGDGQKDTLSLGLYRGLQYGRLALLAEREGRSAQFQQYMSMATASLNELGGKYDEAAVRVVVSRFEPPPPALTP